MIKKNYELLEHTADMRVKVKSKSLKDLFRDVALAMFDIMAERNLELKSSKLKKIVIKQKANNLEELLINWLNELLSLSAIKELIFTDLKVKRMNDNILEAEVFGEDISNYKLNTEIKAATYHQLKIEKINSGWQTEVIFDV
ncbi:MAG: archease [Candidatus Omnitrophica bacterium]|nr:archease [Candidatus Omnitrophota bacterium]